MKMSVLSLLRSASLWIVIIAMMQNTATIVSGGKCKVQVKCKCTVDIPTEDPSLYPPDEIFTYLHVENLEIDLSPSKRCKFSYDEMAEECKKVGACKPGEPDMRPPVTLPPAPEWSDEELNLINYCKIPEVNTTTIDCWIVGFNPPEMECNMQCVQADEYERDHMRERGQSPLIRSKHKCNYNENAKESPKDIWIPPINSVECHFLPFDECHLKLVSLGQLQCYVYPLSKLLPYCVVNCSTHPKVHYKKIPCAIYYKNKLELPHCVQWRTISPMLEALFQDYF